MTTCILTSAAAVNSSINWRRSFNALDLDYPNTMYWTIVRFSKKKYISVKLRNTCCEDEVVARVNFYYNGERSHEFFSLVDACYQSTAEYANHFYLDSYKDAKLAVCQFIALYNVINILPLVQ